VEANPAFHEVRWDHHGDTAIRDLTIGDGLYFAIAPIGSNGLSPGGPGTASLGADYAELRIGYRLP